MTPPRTDILYRIQSADHLTYLEVLNQTAPNPPLGLRLFKDTNRQHWKFSKYGEDEYAILNVANGQYLWDSGNEAGTTTGTAYRTKNVVFRDNSYNFFWKNEGNPKVYHLQPLDTDSTKVDFLEPQPKNQDSRRWNLIPVVTAPLNYNLLPSEKYRIRSLDGRSLLTMPIKDLEKEPGVYADEQLPECENQRWSVSLQQNGRCTVKSDSNSTKPYLGYNASSPQVGENVVCVSSNFEWDLRNVGGFAWSLCAPGTELAVGVPNLQVRNGDKLTLAKRDSTPSQIWFFEKHVTLNPEQVHIKRQPGIENGLRTIESAQSVDGQKSFMTVEPRPWRITPGPRFGDTFELTYIGDSPRFTLKVSGDQTLLVTINQDGLLSFSKTKATEFVLLKSDKHDPGYHICLAENPQRAVSARTEEDLNGNNLYTIEAMKGGDLLQMWTI